MHPFRLITALLPLLAAACGADPAPEVEIPSWAKVAPEQIAEAKKHGVPVAFENDLGMRFVLIPAGTFWMGSPVDEEGRREDETQHEVTLSKPFYMSIYEVTNGQYHAFDVRHTEVTRDDDPLLPVVRVTHGEAHAFAEWLSARDSIHTYRLPFEAEWEYACRAATDTPHSSPAAELPRVAWYRDNAGSARHAVGGLLANPWGLHDMHGNVHERCDFQPRIDVAGSAPQRVAEEWERPVRGGYYKSSPRNLRSARRFISSRLNRWSIYGFRFVSRLPEPGEGGR